MTIYNNLGKLSNWSLVVMSRILYNGRVSQRAVYTILCRTIATIRNTDLSIAAASGKASPLPTTNVLRKRHADRERADQYVTGDVHLYGTGL